MSFKDIKGHDKSICMLKSYVEQFRLAGSYLFVGPEGVGKGMVARILAKAVNCLEYGFDTSLGVNIERSRIIDSCDRCASCIKIDSGNHPDVHWIPETISDNDSSDTAADTIKIEHIRQLQKDISLKPYEARIKTFIINKAENLTLEAANAFLKILEEPPRDSLIILVTSKPKLLLPTIISRCQKIRFSCLGNNFLKELLIKEYKMDSTFSHYLAYFSDGRLGKALNLKDKDALINKNRIIDYFIQPTPAGGGFTNLANHNVNIEVTRDKIKESLDILLSWFRDIYFVKIGISHIQLINIDRKNDLINLMNRYSFTELDSIFNFISNAALYLEQNVNAKLLLSNLRTMFSFSHK